MEMTNESSLIEYLEYEFPQKMETEPQTILNLVEDYENGVDSINGLNPNGGVVNYYGIDKGYGDETLMCYIEDRLINEKWEDC